jgi:hypothetical protein
MTKTKKQKRFATEEIEKVIPIDRWGNFTHNNYRIKMKKNLFRLEERMSTGWHRIKSVNYRDATTKCIKEIISYMFKEVK